MKKIKTVRLLGMILTLILMLHTLSPKTLASSEKFLSENSKISFKMEQERFRKSKNKLERNIKTIAKKTIDTKTQEGQSRKARKKARKKNKTTSRKKNKKKKTSKDNSKESLYLPNSIVHNGKRVMFSQSSYDYYSDNDTDEYLDKRFQEIEKEFKDKNINVGPEFNGEDGESSYIMGHNPGTMANLSSLKVGDSVFVTDKHGKTFEYIIVDFVNHKKGYDFEYGSGDVSDYFYEGLKKEAVFIQFCINHESHTFLGYPKKDLKK